MENFLERLKPQLPTILVTILTIRAAAFGAGFGDSLAILGLAGLLGYKTYLDTKIVKNPTDELIKEVDKLKGEVSQISIAVSQRKPQQPVSFRF